MLKEAHTSPTIMRAFWVGFVLLLFLAVISFLLAILSSLQGISSNWWLYLLGGIFLALIAVSYGYFYGWKKRTYLLAEDSIIVLKKGFFVSFERKLLREDIHGYSVESNLLTRMLGLASIEFYGPSFEASSKKLFNLFTVSSSPFRFRYLSPEDVEAFLTLIEGE